MKKLNKKDKHNLSKKVLKNIFEDLELLMEENLIIHYQINSENDIRIDLNERAILIVDTELEIIIYTDLYLGNTEIDYSKRIIIDVIKEQIEIEKIAEKHRKDRHLEIEEELKNFIKKYNK